MLKNSLGNENKMTDAKILNVDNTKLKMKHNDINLSLKNRMTTVTITNQIISNDFLGKSPIFMLPRN